MLLVRFVLKGFEASFSLSSSLRNLGTSCRLNIFPILLQTFLQELEVGVEQLVKTSLLCIQNSPPALLCAMQKEEREGTEAVGLLRKVLREISACDLEKKRENTKESKSVLLLLPCDPFFISFPQSRIYGPEIWNLVPQVAGGF